MSLYGRDVELAELAELIDSARRGNGRALRLTGEAGIGKSALLAEAVTSAEGVRVLEARALEAELGLPFAVIKDLVDPLAGHLDEVPPVQRAALSGALALGPPTPGDRFAAFAGLVSLLAAAAADQPLVLCVDDIQWADRAGAEALLYVSRRIGNDPIAILAGQRLGEPEPLDLSEIPERRIEGLDPDAARALLADADRQIGDEITQQILDHAQGNPLALIEIPGTLTDEQLAGVAQLPVPLSGGARIEELFGRLLERELSDEDRHAVAVAALSMGGDPQSIRGALSELSLDESALERAETANILALSPARVEFRHPLLRSAAAASLDPAETRAAHQALANALTDQQLIERAYHRVRAADAKDEALAEELEAAAGLSMAQGAHAVAADLLLRAVQVSEEPPTAIGRGGQAAMAAFLSGDLPGATSLLEQALSATPPDPARAELEHMLGTFSFYLGDTEGGLSLLEQTGARVGESAPETSAVVLADASLFATVTADCRRAARLSGEAVVAAERGSDPAVRANAVGADCHARLTRGEATFPEIEEAAAMLANFAAPGTTHALRLAVLAYCATVTGHSDRALSYLEQHIRQARASAMVSAIPFALLWRGHALSQRGQTDQGIASISEGLGFANESGQVNAVALGLALRAPILANRGDLAAARESAEHCIGMVATVDSTGVFAHRALGLIDLVDGRHQEVVDRLGPLDKIVRDDYGMEHPGIEPIGPVLFESLVALGRLDDAQALADRYTGQCERADSGLGWAYSDRMSGMLAAETGRSAHEGFVSSIERFASMDHRFEEGRSRLAYGEVLAVAGPRNAAVEQLVSARNLFQDGGEIPWRTRADKALSELGGTALGPDGDRPTLTPHERQVADLVVDGMKNDEIAEQLFVTRRTVESHLTSVYRKLGIERRTQLAAALGRRP